MAGVVGQEKPACHVFIAGSTVTRLKVVLSNELRMLAVVYLFLMALRAGGCCSSY